LSGIANVYLGTSEFAAEVLRTLAGSRHPPTLVVTPPDRKRGRGRKLAPPPVAELARELDLELHQTTSVNEPASLALLRDAGAEWGCVCAFGQLIKEPLLSVLPMLNVHPSLLPRWRGAAPIERAIMAGDGETGVCVMRLTEGLDSGPVAISERVAIEPGTNFGSLAAKLARRGGELLVRALDLAESGELEFEAQQEDGATYAEKIGREDRRLDPARPAIELERRVAALTPHIGAYLELGDEQRLGVRSARAETGGADPGEVAVRDGRLIVGCFEGALAIDELQPQGKRAMATEDWIRGHEPPSRVPVG
jgi:methionyl-tRNA formyltransferase